MSEQREPAFLAVVYHDEPEDAATNSKAEWRSTLEDATEWAREQMRQPYWNAYPSTVDSGYVVRDPHRFVPPRWEDEENPQRWLVYADSIERD